MSDREPPYSVNRGHRVVDGRWLLTNAEWHPSTLGGSDIGCPETGVRNLHPDGTAVDGSFRLIQHGWWNFDAACDLIARGLRKGWDTDRIGDVLERLKHRQSPRAVVL